jgi:hypothetical protein
MPCSAKERFVSSISLAICMPAEQAAEGDTLNQLGVHLEGWSGDSRSFGLQWVLVAVRLDAAKRLTPAQGSCQLEDGTWEELAREVAPVGTFPTILERVCRPGCP